MRNLEIEIKSISLTPRTLSIGSQWSINCSTAFCGIEEGHVIVKKIIEGENVPADVLEIWLDHAEGVTNYATEYWVVYTETKRLGAQTWEIQWMPLEIFEEHISIY